MEVMKWYETVPMLCRFLKYCILCRIITYGVRYLHGYQFYTVIKLHKYYYINHPLHISTTSVLALDHLQGDKPGLELGSNNQSHIAGR